MKNKTLFITVITILIVLLLIALIIVGRKAIIITSLSRKATSTINTLDNYYVKMNFYQGDDSSTLEVYKKDETSLSILTSLSTNFKHIEFSNGQTTNMYIESDKDNVANLDIEGTLIGFIDIRTIYDNNFKSIFLNSLVTHIESTKCNGYECYYIKNFNSPSILGSEGFTGIYIDKQTGLPIRILGGTITSINGSTDQIIDYSYEFNSVTDEDIKEPDLSQYKINN